MPSIRFRLSGLLIAVAVIGLWLAHQRDMVRRRVEVRAQLEALGAEIDDESGQYPLPPGAVAVVPTSLPGPRVSMLRRALGDRAIWGVSFPPDTPAELLERFDRQFPEVPRQYRVY